jgi:hypothetical protein
MEYHYSDLNSLADSFENEARKLRASMSGKPGSKKLKDIELRERAAAFESVAYTIRHTKLGG